MNTDQIFEAFDQWERTQTCIRGHVRVVREDVEKLVKQNEELDDAFCELIAGHSNPELAFKRLQEIRS